MPGKPMDLQPLLLVACIIIIILLAVLIGQATGPSNGDLERANVENRLWVNSRLMADSRKRIHRIELACRAAGIPLSGVWPLKTDQLDKQTLTPAAHHTEAVAPASPGGHTAPGLSLAP